MTSDPSAQSSAVPELLMRQVEDAGINASAPTEQLWMDGWIVRYNPGKAKRARCVNAVAPGLRPVADKLNACEQLYQAHGLPLVVRITPFTQPPELDALLDAQGFHVFDESWVMVHPDLFTLNAWTQPSGVRASAVSNEVYAEVVGALRGSPQAQRIAHAQRMATSPVPYRGVVWKRKSEGQDGSQEEVLACGQYAREGELVGLYDVFTAPQARGQGLARKLCASLLVQAREEGARAAYLQVEAGNAAARAVYQRLGFVDAYPYHYRSAHEHP